MEIKGKYDEWACKYDEGVNMTRDMDLFVMQRTIPFVFPVDQLNKKNVCILELGCGSGKNTLFLANYLMQFGNSNSVIACDFSLEMLSLAKKKLEKCLDNVKFLEMDISMKWNNIPDSSVDLVLFNLVLEHISDLSHAFSEAYRVLRNEGMMFFSEYHPKRYVNGGAQFVDEKKRVNLVGSFLTRTKKDFIDSVEKSGFMKISVSSWFDFNKNGKENSIPRLLTVLAKKKSVISRRIISLLSSVIHSSNLFLKKIRKFNFVVFVIFILNKQFSNVIKDSNFDRSMMQSHTSLYVPLLLNF